MNINLIVPAVILLSFTSSCGGKKDSISGFSENKGKNEFNIKYEKPASDTIKQKYVMQVSSSYQNGQPQKVFYFRDSSYVDLLYEVQYYEDGHRKIEGGYSEGKRQGKWIAWYQNDTVWSIGYFRNGYRHGISAVYYPNGQKYYDKSYLNDTAEGKWNFYDENGKLVGEALYRKGVLLKEEKF